MTKARVFRAKGLTSTSVASNATNFLHPPGPSILLLLGHPILQFGRVGVCFFVCETIGNECRTARDGVEGAALSLSSTSSFHEVRNAYLTNSTYAAEGSVEKCRLFMTAVRLLLTSPSMTSDRAGSTEFNNTAFLRDELARAEAWLSRAVGVDPRTGRRPPSVVLAAVNHFRD